MTLTERLKWPNSRAIAESYASSFDKLSPVLEGLAVVTVAEPDCKSAGFSVEKIHCPSMPRQVSRIAFRRSAGRSDAPEATMYV
ncbi:hypothetical protein MTO96_036310 [Rhipicephalus appendiculatus]